MTPASTARRDPDGRARPEDPVMRIPAAFAVALLFVAPAPAGACGASLFDRTETSVVRVWRAPNPAHVLVYVDDTAAARKLGDPQAFERALERSGHEVTVVRTPPELGAALGAQPVDVVIADAALIDSLTADARARSSDAAMLGGGQGD
jgi:PleD family two-component response regulator